MKATGERFIGTLIVISTLDACIFSSARALVCREPNARPTGNPVSCALALNFSRSCVALNASDINKCFPIGGK